MTSDHHFSFKVLVNAHIVYVNSHLEKKVKMQWLWWSDHEAIYRMWTTQHSHIDGGSLFVYVSTWMCVSTVLSAAPRLNPLLCKEYEKKL